MFYGTLRGVGSTGAAVWRRLASFAAACFFEGQSPFLQKIAKFRDNIEVLEVGPKSAPLKTFRLITGRL